MAELDKTISVIESWLKQPVLTPPPIKELYDALELLKEQEETIKRYEHFIGEMMDPDAENQACPPPPKV